MYTDEVMSMVEAVCLQVQAGTLYDGVWGKLENGAHYIVGKLL